jgi:hypothetical protein
MYLRNTYLIIIYNCININILFKIKKDFNNKNLNLNNFIIKEKKIMKKWINLLKM